MRCVADSQYTTDEGGVAAEYAVLVGFVVLIIIVGVGLFGNNLAQFIEGLAARIGEILGG